MHLKSAVVGCLLAASLCTVSFADEVSPLTKSTFSTDDVEGIFEKSTAPLELAALSSAEMQNTEGAWLFPVVSGLGSAAGYIYTTDNWNYAGAATSFATGALGGAIGGYLGLGIGTVGNMYADHVTGW